MDLRVAQRTRLVLGGLVVERRRAGGGSVRVYGMAPQAKEVDIVDLQQTRIRGAMRHMTVQATGFGLYRRVLKNEGSHGVGMALGADGELAGGGPYLITRLEGAVRIVAVAALNESDVNPMAERPGKFGFLRGMAAEAQLGLGLDQQEIHVLEVMWIVTGGAAQAVGQMYGGGEILRLQAGLVTFQADRRALRRAQGLEANDLGGIAAGRHVGLPGTVAVLTSMLFAFQQRRVRRAGKMLFPDVLVAGLANVVGGISACG